MTEHRLGIIMNGITGRMGANQHLARSIIAIRDAGGLALAGGGRVMPDPILVGRGEDKLRRLAETHGIERWTTDLDGALADPGDTVFFDTATTGMRAGLLRKAITAGKHVYCEKPVAANLADALDVAGLAAQAGIKNGVVQDKLFLPGLRKLKTLVDKGFFGRILSVRGEFGYWVFEGDERPAQRPSWNYRAADGGGIILDMLAHWRYVLDNLFGEVESVSCLGANHMARRWDEESQPYDADADDRRLRHLPAQGRHHRPHQQLVVRAGAPRRPGNLPGGRHAGVGGGRLAPLLRPIPLRYAASRVEPGRGTAHRLPRRLGRGARPRRALRQWLQGAVGGLHPSPLRGRPVPVDAAGGRQRRPARRSRPQELGRTALDRHRAPCSLMTGGP